MANLNLKFLRGLQASLPTAGTDGYFYLTTDTHRLYTSIDGKVVPVNEGVTTVENVNALASVTGANAGEFFYCTQENILAVFNGQTFVQINADTGATSIEVVGEGNAVTAASYDAETRKLTLTKGETFATKAYVGDIPTTSEATNIVAYIQEKTAGIATDAALEELTGRVDTTEDEIDAIQEALKGKSDDDHKHVAEDITDLDDVIKAYDYATKTEAKDYADDLDEAMDERVKALEDINPQENVIEKITINGTEQTITDKTVDIPMATLLNLGVVKGSAGANGVIVNTDGTMSVFNVDQSKVNGLDTALAGKQDVIPENTYDTHGAAATAEANAKAYVDEQDVFEIDMLTVNAHGGVAAGTDLNGLTTHEILKKILYPYVEPTLGNATASPNGGTYEKGVTKTINSVSISVTKKSEAITSVALYNGSSLIEEKTGDAVKNGGTITFSNVNVVVPTNGNQLTVKVTDAANKTYEKKTTSMTFVYPYYMGSCAAGTAIDETLVESLTKKVESKGTKSNSFTVSDGHMVFAYPKAHGVLNSILDPNNFETIGNYTRSEVNVTGLDGTTQAYYVYVSGATTVSGFNVTFKY